MQDNAPSYLRLIPSEVQRSVSAAHIDDAVCHDTHRAVRAAVAFVYPMAAGMHHCVPKQQ